MIRKKRLPANIQIPSEVMNVPKSTKDHRKGKGVQTQIDHYTQTWFLKKFYTTQFYQFILLENLGYWISENALTPCDWQMTKHKQ